MHVPHRSAPSRQHPFLGRLWHHLIDLFYSRIDQKTVRLKICSEAVIPTANGIQALDQWPVDPRPLQ